MKKNDDIVGQKIDNIVELKDILGTVGIEIRLSNGMIIDATCETRVFDAGIEWEIKRWVTVRDGKRVRIPQAQQEVENAPSE